LTYLALVDNDDEATWPFQEDLGVHEFKGALEDQSFVIPTESA
jgi:hypothetical protein